MDKSKEITVLCINDGKRHKIEPGTTLKELSAKVCKTVKEEKTGNRIDVLAALVDNELKDLNYRVSEMKQIQFVGYDHSEGRRTYIRSLSFVLQKAVSELFPEKSLLIDHSLPSGLYCELQEPVRTEDGLAKTYFVKDEDIDAIRERMKLIVAQDLPFTKEKMDAEKACELFEKEGMPLKAELQRSLGVFYCNVSRLGDRADSFHGPLLPSTGYLKLFDLIGIGSGMCLQYPHINDFSKLMPIKRQTKIANTLKEYSDWCSIIGIRGIGSLNKEILGGNAVRLINMAEALQERNYARIADKIYENRATKKIVMIAGPSSSGKTSSSLRIAMHCRVLGLTPKVIELDNYFVDRDRTPKDEYGEYDFESLHAMDLEFLNNQLNQLLAGEEVEIPKYDFKNGCRAFVGNRIKLEESDILIMEGIHALNPEMTSAVDDSRIFRVFVSALTSLNIDENNTISTSDNRLLRRMIRDNRTRGIIPEETILRWYSVRRGESRNIFPFQENADAIFNSALIFELPMLKYYAEPLLRRISPNSPAYAEACRLLKFLEYIVALQPDEISAIPPTSIMREFIGGQTL
ncbi:MAG: nucleoside kinase [Bacteroidales bacterium]|nr:nucleoside kinase [Bacteroidales bacterium]